MYETGSDYSQVSLRGPAFPVGLALLNMSASWPSEVVPFIQRLSTEGSQRRANCGVPPLLRSFGSVGSGNKRGVVVLDAGK